MRVAVFVRRYDIALQATRYECQLVIARFVNGVLVVR